MPQILVPGARDDVSILSKLGTIIPTKFKSILDTYINRTKNYEVRAPFPVPDAFTVADGEVHMFVYRQRIFSGKITSGAPDGPFLFDEKTLVQHMENGTVRNKGIDNEAISSNAAFKELPQLGDPQGGFWGSTEFWKAVPKSHLLDEQQFYGMLKPFYQFVEFVHELERSSPGTAAEQEAKRKLMAVLYEGPRRMGYSGKRPREEFELDAAKSSKPGKPFIERVGPRKVKVSWPCVDSYSFKFAHRISTNTTPAWKIKNVYGTSVILDVPDGATKIEAAVALNRFNADSNDIDADVQDPDSKPEKWSIASTNVPKIVSNEETFTDTGLYDIDKFRLEIDGKYNTIFDIMELMDVPKTSTLFLAVVEVIQEAGDLRKKDTVDWDHLKIPVDWNDFTYTEKVLTICAGFLDSFDAYIRAMAYYGLPKYRLSEFDYSKPPAQGGTNLSGVAKGKEPQDFDVVDRAIDYAKYRHQRKQKLPLDMPWAEAQKLFKKRDRVVGTHYADFVYLRNDIERDACKRLRRIDASLRLSNTVGKPVVQKHIIAPYNYESHAHSGRVTKFGQKNYDATQSYPALRVLPRIMNFDPIAEEKVYYSTSQMLNFDSRAMREAEPIKVRENSSGWLPHPMYPSRKKVESWQRILQKDKTYAPGKVIFNYAALRKKPKVKDTLVLQL